jgi:hypothetical protein
MKKNCYLLKHMAIFVTAISGLVTTLMPMHAYAQQSNLNYKITIVDPQGKKLTQGVVHPDEPLNSQEEHQYVARCDFNNQSSEDYLATMNTGLQVQEEGDELQIDYSLWHGVKEQDNDGCKIEHPQILGFHFTQPLSLNGKDKISYKIKPVDDKGYSLSNQTYTVNIERIR